MQRGKGEVKSYEVLSNQDNQFVFSAGTGNHVASYLPRSSTDELKSGTYTLWASVTDERGAKSDFSNRVTFVVEGLSLLVISDWLIKILTVAVPLIALIALIIFIFWFAWHKFALFKKKIRNKIIEAENKLHKAFKLLRGDVRDQVKLLEKTKSKRSLTKEEEKIKKELKQSLIEAEKLIKSGIKSIKKRDKSK
jgi:hypothetical protein